MSHAIFLSYASQDAEAARRICESLRSAGVEVWFDQSELRGGDAWDQKIRHQIKECALFVPIISANTQHRDEGYFRLEWHLAEQRSLLMARGRPFIVPVCVDATADAEALVPDAFLAVQWMRLPAGQVTASFCERMKTLLHGAPAAPTAIHDGAAPVRSGVAAPGARSPRGWKPLLLGIVVLAAVIAVAFTLHRQRERAGAPAVTPSATEKMSPARELIARAHEITLKGSLTRDQLDTAGELCDRALQLDPTDALVWAEAARTDLLLIFPYGYDRSDERRKRAQERAMRAFNLDPGAFEVRVTHSAVLAHAIGTPAQLAEAEKTFRELIATHPDDKDLVIQLAEVLRESHRYGEAAKLFESVGQFEVAGWSYLMGGKPRAGLAAVKRAPRTATALQLNAILEINANEDLDAARTAIDQLRPGELLAEMPVAIAMKVFMYRREPERILELARGLTRDYMDSNAFSGPRGYFTGMAQAMAGRQAQAEAEWRAALVVVDERLKTKPDDRILLLWAAWLHAALHETTVAGEIFARSQALAGLSGDTMDSANLLTLMQLRKKDALLAGAALAFRTKEPTWQTLHTELRFDPGAEFMRGDPRFEQLMRDNLPSGARPFADPEKRS